MRFLNQRNVSTAITSVLVQRSMTEKPTASGIDGQPRGTYLKLTDEDARAFEEYQSMLKQRSSRLSRESDDHARLKKLPKPGDTCGTAVRRPCPVI